MPVTHEPWLVALSLIVAIQGAYVGLSLAVKVGAALGLRRRLLLAGAAVSLAVAIWAMHFVAMLAARLPPVDYLVLPTLLSFLVCVLVVGAAVFAASAGPLTALRLAAAAAFMGSGIVSMHYTGMTALHASAHLIHATSFVVASVVIAIAASGLALWLAAGRGRRLPLILSATALGMAISGMHYTAMAGLTVFPHAHPLWSAPALSTDLLAIVVAVVAFVVSGIFLLTLVPERSGTQVRATADLRSEARPEQITINGHMIPSVAAPASTNEADGGSGQRSDESAPGPRPGPAHHLPIERDGATQFVAVDDIVAIHANAHYTYIFDGTTKLFCPLPIGSVEARLDDSRFIRVHRSHIVNIDRVVGLRRSGDTGILELAAVDRYRVPVSRSRFGSLKSRLGVRHGEAVS